MILNRLLLYFVPDKQATILAAGLSLVSFLIGLLDMISRDFNSASFYLNLSVGIMGALFVLKFLSMRATYQVAEHAQHQFQQHLRKKRTPQQPSSELTPEQARAQEKREMSEMADTLRQALNNIAADSPVRPKYEATLEMMDRMAQRS